MGEATVPIIDDQRVDFNSLHRLFSNFKKEALIKRNADRLKYYEEQREFLWERITKRHSELTKADPPPPKAYMADYDRAKEVYDEWISREKTWLKGDTKPATTESDYPNPDDPEHTLPHGETESDKSKDENPADDLLHGVTGGRNTDTNSKTQGNNYDENCERFSQQTKDPIDRNQRGHRGYNDSDDSVNRAEQQGAYSKNSLSYYDPIDRNQRGHRGYNDSDDSVNRAKQQGAYSKNNSSYYDPIDRNQRSQRGYNDSDDSVNRAKQHPSRSMNDDIPKQRNQSGQHYYYDLYDSADRGNQRSNDGRNQRSQRGYNDSYDSAAYRHDADTSRNRGRQRNDGPGRSQPDHYDLYDSADRGNQWSNNERNQRSQRGYNDSHDSPGNRHDADTTRNGGRQRNDGLSWNQMINQETGQNLDLQQILMMLAQNQLQHNTLKPPELQVKVFDGKFKEYRAFKDMFAKVVSKTRWSNVERLMFLKSKVTGEAADSIENFILTNENYRLAWEHLDESYNNPRKLLQSTMELFDNAQGKTKANDVKSFVGFVNNYTTIMANLTDLEVTVEDIVVDLLLKRLDSETRKRFEDFIGVRELWPTIKQLNNFFTKEKLIQVNLQQEHPSAEQHKDKTKANSKSTKSFATQSNDTKKPIQCFICKKEHRVPDCELLLANNNREAFLRQNRICIFCLKHKYDATKKCRSYNSLSCDKCQGKHHTLMHPISSNTGATAPASTSSATENVSQVHFIQEDSNHIVLMPTAIADILDKRGNSQQIRCLLDFCAERSYICEHLVQTLRLKKYKTKVIIRGVNGIYGVAKSYVKLTIKIPDSDVADIKTTALVVPKVTGKVPSLSAPSHIAKIDKPLADPSFFKPSYIGALLGSEVTAKLYKPGVPSEITADGLLLQPTHLGWVVAGGKARPSHVVSTFVTFNESFEKAINDDEMNKRILDFYELPEPEEHMTPDDEYCERLFQEKHYRLDNGRYVVPTPWKRDALTLGHSYRTAVKMFLGQESKWLKNPIHYNMSNDFMHEYESMGHMTRIETNQEKNDSGDVYYIPYLSVIKTGAMTTKLRNVFNASMKTSNGVSLNETMMKGPKLQNSIKEIITTSRSFRYIFSSDISKMFRQINIAPEDRDKQRIIWRPSNDQPLREYRLNTVTYGTDSAPFLAIRTIQQCATDNATDEVATIIRRSFYVDDLLYGADTICDSQKLIENIKTCLLAGQFPLAKWMSNEDEILENLSPQEKVTQFMTNNSTEMKILGVSYDFSSDEFVLNFKKPEAIKFTKRGISSASASFYDPLGFILPFVMSLRMFLQKIWQQKVDWDDVLLETWQRQFEQQIKGIDKFKSIRIPRYIPANEDGIVDLVGFSDASNLAQAAVIYGRAKIDDGYKVSLLVAKGNVSKFKSSQIITSKQCTIPKLELQALVTLADLYESIKPCFEHRQLRFTAYTDSQVVLAWVRSPTQTGKKFVDKRIFKIKSIIEPGDLHYVKSEENPADPASRGLHADQLASCSLWFSGPTWLQDDVLPHTPFHKEVQTFVAKTEVIPEEDMLSKFSSWTRMMMVTAFCLRWKHHSDITYIRGFEISRAKERAIKYYQQLHLSDVIRNLQAGKPAPKRHWLYRLSPFLDKDGIIRVGGRLGNASFINESQRHPIVIPKSHYLKIFVNFTHLNNDHAIPSLMLRILVEEYWIPGIRNVIQQCIRTCPKCIRWNAQVIQPMMGQLPQARVTPSSTFEKVGLDLSGPFIIKASPLRFDKTMKIWVVNFVCLSTKAVHLEIVSSLSTEDFLAAFSRYCSRRGTSSEVWSDNGTNLVGANRHLRETWQKIIKDAERSTAIQEVSWKHIPRHSPTFGGLWEACVKSMKYFVKRMMGAQNLTYEQFHTMLCKIEALLNSRPLFKNPLNPEEDPALTPFHFINQKGYKPNPVDGSDKTPLTKKYLIIHQIQQAFWERFRVEYLRELQYKVKWQIGRPNLAVDDVVLIKEPDTIQGYWKMGRVTRTFPDKQGVVRKVEVSTPSKENRLHATNQLVPLLKPDNVPEKEDPVHIPHPQNPVPTRRTSPRNKTKVSLVHLCLLALMVFVPSTSSQIYDELPPGVTLKRGDNVYKRALDFTFTIKTNLNLTNDMATIHQTVTDFKDECIRLGTSSASVKHQCDTLEHAIEGLADQTSKRLTSGYSSRTRRWIASLWKAAPVVASAAGMIYQQYQINNLQDELTDAKGKVQKAVSVLLNITEVQYEAVEYKLNEVIDKQKEISLEEEILNYAEKVEVLFEQMALRHENIVNIEPLDELIKAASPIILQAPDVILPDIGTSIFKVHPRIKSRSEDMTVVIFHIPMVLSTPFIKWHLISIPLDNGKSIVLPNGKRSQSILTDVNNITFADLTSTHLIHPNIASDIQLKSLKGCLLELVQRSNIVSCEEEKMDDISGIVELDDNEIIIFGNGTNESMFDCHQEKTIQFHRAVIIHNGSCINYTTMYDDHQSNERIEFHSTSSEVNKLKQSPTVEHWRQTLLEEWGNWRRPTTRVAISGVVGCGILAIIIITFIACCHKSRSQPQTQSLWYPGYIGPLRPSSAATA